MSYTQLTQASLAAEISAILQDSSNVFWTLDEIYRAIDEGLLLWGALTSYWVDRATFAATISTPTPFYDLSSKFPAIRKRTITFGQLTREIQYHLMEPANGVVGTGMSDQFSITAILTALNRRRNQFVIDSKLPFSFAQFVFPPAPVYRMDLDQSIAVIQRATWLDNSTGIYRPLRRIDAHAAKSRNHVWNIDPGMPFGYSQAEDAPNSIRVVPPPLADGKIHLVYTATANLNKAESTSFAVPDEFAAAIKWAALYELLSSSGQGFDPVRARYCLERYVAAVEMAGLLRSVIQVEANGKLLSLDTLSALDAARPFWMNKLGTPTLAATAYDLLALSDVPKETTSITCDLCAAAPLPGAPAGWVDVGLDEISYLIDYCCHVLSFKLGGAEFASTMRLYDNFLRGAGQRNRLLAAKARYMEPIFSVQRKESDVTQPA